MYSRCCWFDSSFWHLSSNLSRPCSSQFPFLFISVPPLNVLILFLFFSAGLFHFKVLHWHQTSFPLPEPLVSHCLPRPVCVCGTTILLIPLVMVCIGRGIKHDHWGWFFGRVITMKNKDSTPYVWRLFRGCCGKSSISNLTYTNNVHVCIRIILEVILILMHQNKYKGRINTTYDAQELSICWINLPQRCYILRYHLYRRVWLLVTYTKTLPFPSGHIWLLEKRPYILSTTHTRGHHPYLSPVHQPRTLQNLCTSCVDLPPVKTFF